MSTPPRPVADAAANVGPTGLPSSLDREGARANTDALPSDASTPLESRVALGRDLPPLPSTPTELGEGKLHPLSRHDTLSTVKSPSIPGDLEASPEKTAPAPPPDAGEGKARGHGSHGEARVKVSLARRLVIVAGLFLATFLAAMDQTIVAVVLSTLAKEFDAMSSSAWVGTAYLLTMATFQPLYGKLSDIFGRLQLLMFALGVFLLGSALCGAAKSMTWLIIARGLTGIGGGGLLTLAVVIIGDITPLKSRGMYIGLFSLAWAVASSAGPLIGGTFADKVSWRWCFYINLPIGAATVVTSLLFIRIPVERETWLEKLKRVDFLGSFIVVTSLILILLALSWGGKTYAWNSAVVIALLVVGFALLAVFVVVEAYIPPEPILDLSLFNNRTIPAVLIASTTAGMVAFSLFYYVPIFFSAVFNASAVKAGIHLIPLQVANTLATLITGQVMSCFGHMRLLTVTGFALATVGAGLVTLLRPDSGTDKQVGYLLLCGIGTGMTVAPNIVIAQGAVKPRQMAVSTTLVIFTRTIGGVFGLAIADAVFANALRPRLQAIGSQHPEYAHTLMASQDDVSLIWDSGFPADVRRDAIYAYSESLHKVFITLIPLSAIGFLASLVLKRIEPASKEEEGEAAPKPAAPE
ncbi:hypothetical protein EV182_000527 [Spiromyces aspiralis]|uniref:Uncharacterized protein n=1 Tax=Spiromyces aspiralis TaxID=68401 RepID=A0ACC1HXX2_9FUNG|nr:hypothetical protein EV182_000527 [Spiromyces aspiralis]